MNFYYGELNNFNLCKMGEDIKNEFFIKICEKGISKDFDSSKKEIKNILQSSKTLYYSFGRRVDNHLLCANNQRYEIDDDRSTTSQGVYMADAYFNRYDDINLGFLISYDDGKIKIEPALEGESIECRKYEVIEDCGDLNIEMKNFIENYIK